MMPPFPGYDCHTQKKREVRRNEKREEARRARKVRRQRRRSERREKRDKGDEREEEAKEDVMCEEARRRERSGKRRELVCSNCNMPPTFSFPK